VKAAFYPSLYSHLIRILRIEFRSVRLIFPCTWLVTFYTPIVMNKDQEKKLGLDSQEKISFEILLFLKRLHTLLMLLVILGAVLRPSLIFSAITTTGDVSPTDPATWINTTYGYVGNSLDGSLLVDGGSDLLSSNGYIGNNSNVSGEVTINGTGSVWTDSVDLYVGKAGIGTLNIKGGGIVNSDFSYIGSDGGSTGIVNVDGTGSQLTGYELNIGYSGNGTLNISNSGAVSTDGITQVAWGISSTGAINFGVGGGTLTTKCLLASPSQLTGSGTITTSGLISDTALVFDSTHGLNQSLQLNNVTVNIVKNTSPISQQQYSYMGAGYKGTGSLTIRDGVKIQNDRGYVGYKAGSSGVATVDGIGSKWSNTLLTVGYAGNGIVNISGGGEVTADSVEIAGASGSTGMINFISGGGTLTTKSLKALPSQFTGSGIINTQGIVSDIDLVFDSTHGPNQTIWFNDVRVNLTQNLNGNLGAGYRSAGSIIIRDGQNISSYMGSVGNTNNSLGIAKVEGIGSKWSVNASLSILGGTLNILDGGTVTARSAVMSGQSSLVIDVGKGGSIVLDNGNGRFLGGNIRLLAGASPTANAIYTPIIAYNIPNVQALGGKWNSTNRDFIVSEVQSGNSGTPVTIDRLYKQRILVDDSASSHWKLGASFASTSSTSSLTFTSTAVSDGPLNALKGKLGSGQQILGGWTLSSSSGYSNGSPLYLSFGADNMGGYSTKDMQLLSYDGTAWSNFSAFDLTYDGVYANFTATKLGCYAVIVPEPSILVLLAFGLLGFVLVGRRFI
jgi:T5SS/PEP-CTERM-associated repeat protein